MSAKHELTMSATAPIGVLFKLQAEPRGFRLGEFVSAAARGRPEGTGERHVWPASTPSVEELQERIAEAVTAAVSLENLLHIRRHFGALPKRTVAIEVKSEAQEGRGPDRGALALAALDQVEALVLEEVAASSRAGADDV